MNDPSVYMLVRWIFVLVLVVVFSWEGCLENICWWGGVVCGDGFLCVREFDMVVCYCRANGGGD